jgi:hypothetical protein
MKQPLKSTTETAGIFLCVFAPLRLCVFAFISPKQPGSLREIRIYLTRGQSPSFSPAIAKVGTSQSSRISRGFGTTQEFSTMNAHENRVGGDLR